MIFKFSNLHYKQQKIFRAIIETLHRMLCVNALDRYLRTIVDSTSKRAIIIVELLARYVIAQEKASNVRDRHHEVAA